MQSSTDVAGVAALAICESLMLALNERCILPETEILGVLTDAVAAHTDVPQPSYPAATHLAVAHLIKRIIDGGNSVRHRS